MALRPGRDRTIRVKDTGKYINVYHRVGEDEPVIDINLFDGKIDSETLAHVVLALAMAQMTVLEWKLEDEGKPYKYTEVEV